MQEGVDRATVAAVVGGATIGAGAGTITEVGLAATGSSAAAVVVPPATAAAVVAVAVVQCIHYSMYHIYESSVNQKQAKGEDLCEKSFCDLGIGWF